MISFSYIFVNFLLPAKTLFSLKTPERICWEETPPAWVTDSFIPNLLTRHVSESCEGSSLISQNSWWSSSQSPAQAGTWSSHSECSYWELTITRLLRNSNWIALIKHNEREDHFCWKIPSRKSCLRTVKILISLLELISADWSPNWK